MGMKNSNPDKFKKLVLKQNVPEKPKTLGEPVSTTDWFGHIEKEHTLDSYANIVPLPGGNKEVHVHTPNPGTKFIAEIEMVHSRYHWIWIYCIEIATGRVIFKENSGAIDFVIWNIPEGKISGTLAQ